MQLESYTQVASEGIHSLKAFNCLPYSFSLTTKCITRDIYQANRVTLIDNKMKPHAMCMPYTPWALSDGLAMRYRCFPSFVDN